MCKRMFEEIFLVVLEFELSPQGKKSMWVPHMVEKGFPGQTKEDDSSNSDGPSSSSASISETLDKGMKCCGDGVVGLLYRALLSPLLRP